ncbi:hypothetical protein, partial [Neobacillus cucumis]|uniref:hypothetical protein n=1 Tax=Neobacillus cucumis TaxID=1740721 RepID=UPI002E1ABDCC|nr:hypothetical protein [Neobacillus cucumis]
EFGEVLPFSCPETLGAQGIGIMKFIHLIKIYTRKIILISKLIIKNFFISVKLSFVNGVILRIQILKISKIEIIISYFVNLVVR